MSEHVCGYFKFGTFSIAVQGIFSPEKLCEDYCLQWLTKFMISISQVECKREREGGKAFTTQDQCQSQELWGPIGYIFCGALGSQLRSIESQRYK